MRSRTIVVAVLCALFLAGTSYAQEQAQDMEQGKKKMMSCEHMKDTSMCAMRGGMGCSGMMGMGREMVAASDGGVIVLAGFKLYKYDKDLNLKKEVELKIDKKMMEKCRLMCGQMDDKKEDMKAPEAEGDGG